MNNRKLTPTAQRIRYIVADLVVGALAFWVFNIVRFYILGEYKFGYSNLGAFLTSTKLILEQCIVPFGLLGIYWLSGYYNLPFGKSRLQELNTTILSALASTTIIYLILLINDQTGHRIINYEIIIVLFGLLFLPTYMARICLTEYAIAHFKKNHWKLNVLIIGNSETAKKVAEKLVNSNSKVRYNIAGFVRIPWESEENNSSASYELKDVSAICNVLGISQIILAPKVFDDKKVLELVSSFFPLDIPIKISPDPLSFLTSAIKLRDIYAEPFIDLASPSMGESSKNIKRAFDVCVSIIIMMLLSPLYGFIALLIKSSSRGKIIYKQERIGLHQKPFTIYKFRTMIEDSEPDGPQLSEDNDSRITKTGRWLRKYRLDELPQFWNVLKGEMSVVGPRPEREYFIRKIVKEAPYYTLVCQVRPGITSWGMVKYGYASSVDQMVERTKYDLLYLSNMSLSVDCKILIYTIRTIFLGKGK